MARETHFLINYLVTLLSVGGAAGPPAFQSYICITAYNLFALPYLSRADQPNLLIISTVKHFARPDLFLI